MKANERNRTTEKRLLEKTALLENTRKELEQCKRELKKLQKSIDCHPTVHSELLNVISFLSLDYLLRKCEAGKANTSHSFMNNV